MEHAACDLATPSLHCPQQLGAASTTNQDILIVAQGPRRLFVGNRTQSYDSWHDKRISRGSHFTLKYAKENLCITGPWNPRWVEAEVDASKRTIERTYAEVTTTYPRDPIKNYGAPSMDCFRKDENDAVLGACVPPEALNKECSQGGLYEALQSLEDMSQRGIHISTTSFFHLLERCIEEKDLAAGRKARSLIERNGLESDVFLGSHLIRMFSLFESLSEANEVFSKLSEPNVFAWSAIVSANAKLGKSERAIQLYHEMEISGVKPNGHVFVAVIQAFARIADQETGKLIHSRITESGFESDVFVGNSLIDMYLKCGSFQDARVVFDRLVKRDIFSWTLLISGCASNGRCEEVLQLFYQMRQVGAGINPNRAIFVSTLRACSNMKILEQGIQMHAHTIENGFESDVFVGNSLIDMYGKCGGLRNANMVFDRLPERDVVSWSALIAGHSQLGHGNEALQLYKNMRQVGIKPDQATYVCILKACSSIAALDEGTLIHADIKERRFTSDERIGNTLVDMYCKCGSLEDACMVFDMLPRRTVVSWNAMIGGYAHCGYGQQALHLFHQMLEECMDPNIVTYVCILKACSSIAALDQGKQVHTQIMENGFDLDLIVGNALIDMYGKCGSLLNAQNVFDNLPNRDIVTWNGLIGGYTEHGYNQEALHLFQQMRQMGIEPSLVSFVSILKVCSNTAVLEQGKQIHAYIVDKGVESEVLVGTSLIDMYDKCGSLEDGQMVFDRMLKPDVAAWNALIAGYAQHGHGKEAVQLFQQMQQGDIQPDQVTFVCTLKACSSIVALEKGKEIHALVIDRGLKSDIFVGNTLIDMYSHCGCLEEACFVFKSMPEKDVATWNAMIASCAQHINYPLASKLFEDMLQTGQSANAVTFTCLLSACSHMGLVHEGCLHFKLMREGHGITPALEHHDLMVDLLGQSGFLNAAEDGLETIPYAGNIVGWISLLNSCKLHGTVDTGRRCFDHVLQTDQGNAAGYVLMSNIYAHAGMWEEADQVEQLRRCANVWNKPAKAFIEIDNQVHDFVVGDKSHPQSYDIYAKLTTLSIQMQREGYMPRLDLGLESIADQDKEDALNGHCEKLAIAFGLICTPNGTTIRVSKNIRMCYDCHSATKLISKIERREIVVTDAYCIHRFKDGACSCIYNY